LRERRARGSQQRKVRPRRRRERRRGERAALPWQPPAAIPHADDVAQVHELGDRDLRGALTDPGRPADRRGGAPVDDASADRELLRDRA
jgi:hypothetical protein